jgi:hypothetical protein
MRLDFERGQNPLVEDSYIIDNAAIFDQDNIILLVEQEVDG